MQHDSGAPAFDNIDDLLAEKIVNHSIKHTDHPKQEPVSSPEQPDEVGGQRTGYEHVRKPPHKLTVFLIISLIVLSILYLLTHSSKNS